MRPRTGFRDVPQLDDARVAQVDQELEAPEPSQVRFHPNLSELYRHKVVELAATLSDPDIRTQAIETIRSLIETVTVSIDEEQVCLEFEGAIAKMIGVALNTKSPLCSGLSVDIINRSVQVVAGARHAFCLPTTAKSVPLIKNPLRPQTSSM
jgi:site-specific DNA recombinase